MRVDYQEAELIPPEIKRRYEIFRGIFAQLDGSSISQNAREDGGIDGAEFTYGEIEFLHFLPLLKLAAPGSGGVFWDLGCGIGKPLIAAAISGMQFREIYGVELLEGLYVAAKSAVEQYCDVIKPGKAANFKLFCQDMTEIDWSDADLVYISSVCFPEALMKKLKEQGRKLKKGARIIALNDWKDEQHFKTIHMLKVKMTWGKANIYIAERI